ncbi:MAG: MBL fold metallo-hydrolase [Phaeodactylibacter sp.]|uniref:MBL fold metallo-hydrolase n=1 Tax=Phaeodactylibacter sp. TaxID=1940289 RepID=UPI0032EBF3A7
MNCARGNRTFLIDPMLGRKGSFGVFPWTDDERANPLVELPFSDEELSRKLDGVDAVFVSHLHPDHWDEAAVKRIDKTTPVICPGGIAKAIASYGFQNILELHHLLNFEGINLHLANGQHGTGEIGEKMGPVNGILFEHQGHSVYIAGDTIWCQPVREVIDAHRPQHIIVAGGAATFAIGQPVTMTAQDIKALAAYAPSSKVCITHLEAVSPCKENRTFLMAFLRSNSLHEQCRVLEDGEEVELL